MLVRNDHLH
jgi:predicted transposase YbfD/YdcC